jgi:hypothetical protein
MLWGPAIVESDDLVFLGMVELLVSLKIACGLADANLD